MAAREIIVARMLFAGGVKRGVGGLPRVVQKKQLNHRDTGNTEQKHVLAFFPWFMRWASPVQ